MDTVDDFFPLYPNWDPSPSPSQQPATALSFHPSFTHPSTSPNLPILPPDDALSILPTSVVTTAAPLHDPTATDLPTDIPPDLTHPFSTSFFSNPSPTPPSPVPTSPPRHQIQQHHLNFFSPHMHLDNHTSLTHLQHSPSTSPDHRNMSLNAQSAPHVQRHPSVPRSSSNTHHSQQQQQQQLRIQLQLQQNQNVSPPSPRTQLQKSHPPHQHSSQTAHRKQSHPRRPQQQQRPSHKPKSTPQIPSHEPFLPHDPHQQHSHQNIFASIPTPTIATGTTITATPSLTNSRSPPRTPRTPHSSNRLKSNTGTQSEVRSSIDKNTCKRQSIASSTAKHSQSSSQLNSSSAQHPMPVTTSRVTKPRDKQARLRKRLKCCSHDQLIDQLVDLVRSSDVSEKLIFDRTPRVDMTNFISKCEQMRDAIYAQLPDDPNPPPPSYDSNAYRRCKKSLANFKSSVLAMGKTLVDAALWSDVIEYSVAAAAVNEQTPIWAEVNHNKSRASVLAKLEQLAVRAATNLTKGKTTLLSSEHILRLIESCRKLFPSVAFKLEGQEPGSAVEGSTEQHPHPNFDPQVVSSSQIEIAM